MRLLTKSRAGSLVAFLGVAAFFVAMQSAKAQADGPRPYDGFLSFPSIHGPSDPEDYSWTVVVPPEETLVQIDDETAGLEWADGTIAMTIFREPARDATGTAVPTTLSVSEGNIVTLTVHHRDGNPAAGGAPFQYPILPGPAYTIGEVTVTVFIPRPPSPPAPELQSCHVPRLTGRNPQAARRSLDASNCRLGKVHHRGTDSGGVARQGPKPGTELPSGAPVWIIVGRG